MRARSFRGAAPEFLQVRRALRPLPWARSGRVRAAACATARLAAAAGRGHGGRGRTLWDGDRRAAQPRPRCGGLRAPDVGLHSHPRASLRRSGAPRGRVLRRLSDRASTARSSAAPPRSSSSGRSRGPARTTASTTRLVYAHWAWFLQPHAAAAWILWKHPQRFPRSAAMICAVFDLGLIGYFLVPTAPPWWAAEHGRIPGMRRIMVEVGEQFWGRLWSPLYGFLGGNPLAAMPSLHFATSVMAATCSPSGTGGRGCRAGPTPARSGFALVYLGEHYVVDLAAGAGAGGGGPAGWARVARRRSRPVRRACGARRGAPRERRAPTSRRQDVESTTRLRGASRPRRGRERGCCSAGGGCSIYGLVVVVILVALYFVLPEIAGLEDSLRKIEDADPVWIAVALGFNLLSFAAYIALFRGILGGTARHRRCASASTGAPRTRSRSPDSPRPGCSRPAARADRAHLLGAAPRRDGGARGGEPHGRVPGAALHGLPGRPGRLRDLPAGRPVPGAEPGRDDDRARGARRRGADRPVPALADPR